ncbi:NB-ARC - like 10 [Theobroma cacao]|nr:NB-ARC - like 10 [Theobroma cacao]
MKAFLEKKREFHACPKELEMLRREMVKKGGGLPLVITMLGGLLATKRYRAQWEMVHKNTNAHLNKFQQQDHYYGVMNGILALSYNELSFHLKPCFLHLGHYPEGFISPSRKSRGMLMENVVEQFLEELIDRCLVQVG